MLRISWLFICPHSAKSVNLLAAFILIHNAGGKDYSSTTCIIFFNAPAWSAT